MGSTLVVINSSNRAGGVLTHNKFGKESDYVIAVPHDQFDEYLEFHEDFRLLPIPEEVPQFLSSQRQWCTEYAIEEGYKYVWFMDDDLTFLRRDPVTLKLAKAKKPDVKMMFEAMRIQLEEVEVPMVGISTRLGNNRVTEDYADTTRVTRCYAFSLEAFLKVGATFAPFEPFLAQDFHMTLCFLNKGYNNRVLYTFAQEDKGSNSDGGCSTYRTPELLKKVSTWMAETHPEVKTKVKKAKAWKGFGATRVDMVVQWKKAYKPKKVRTSKGLSDFFKRH